METNRKTLARTAALLFAFGTATLLVACEEDKPGQPTDTSRSEAGSDAPGDVSGPTDAVVSEGGAGDAGTVETPPASDAGDAGATEVAVAPDAGVKSACLLPPQQCREYAPDYTDVSIKNDCEPNNGMMAAVCPPSLGDATNVRIGKCVLKTEFGTQSIVYYKRSDPTTARTMCRSKMGTWFDQ